SRQSLDISSVVSGNRDQAGRERASTLFDPRDVPGKVNRVHLDYQLEWKGERVQELGISGQQFLLLGVIDLCERLLRASHFHDGAVLRLTGRTKARDAVLDCGQIETSLDRSTGHDNFSQVTRMAGSSPQPSRGAKSAHPGDGPTHHSRGSVS